MKLYNTLSVLDCDTNEDKHKHDEETTELITSLRRYDNYDCAIIIKYFDIANETREPVIKQCKLYDLLDVTSYADTKYGVDLTNVDGYITFICYGTAYELDGKQYLTTTGIQVRPYNNKREFMQLILNYACQ